MKRLLIILLTVLLLIPTISVNAVTDPTPTELYFHEVYDDDSTLIEAANWAFQTFTTGSVSTTITSVKLRLKKTNSDPDTVTVSLRATDTGEPDGADLTSDTMDGNDLTTAYVWYEFEFSEITLEAATTYAIVVRATAASSPDGIYWAMDDAAGYSGGTNGYSDDSGSTWSADSDDFDFVVLGNSAVQVLGGAVFQDYLEDGDMLFVMNYVNTYAPYYPYSDPTRYFYLRLVDTDGTTVISQTVQRAWGNQPGAIYLSADSAASVDTDQQYYLEIYYNFGDNDVAEYQLELVDWKGSDLNALDNWCILTATYMEEWYGITLIEYTTRYVLNEQGGALFKTGIPYLDVVVPDLFKSIVTNPTVPTEPTEAWNDAYNWEALVGDTLATPLNSMGDVFNISGQAVMGIGLFLIYGGLAVFLSNKGYTTAGILVGMPIILIGVYLRVIDIIFMAVALTVIVIIGVWSMWWSRT